MGVAVEPLSELAGPSNEGIAFIHDYALNGWKTASAWEMAQTLPANEQWKPRVMQAIQYGFGAFDF